MPQTVDTLPRPHVQAAQAGLAEAKQARMPLRDYVLVVRQLPTLLRRHGLGLTIAFLQTRGGANPNSPYDLVHWQLDAWLQKSLGVTGRTFLSILCTRDSRFYLEAFSQAELFSRALCTCVEDQK